MPIMTLKSTKSIDFSKALEGVKSVLKIFAEQEDLNFLLTNRIPRRLVT